LAGGAIALAVGAIALVLWARDETPPLTRDRCDAAYRRWQEHAPSGYSLKVRIGGAREADVVVEVRDDRVETMTYNGIVPRTASAREAWTVVSMFDWLDRELEMADELDQPARTTLRAGFDPHFGYPRVYRRLMLGDRPSVHWEVTHFEPIGRKDVASP